MLLQNKEVGDCTSAERWARHWGEELLFFMTFSMPLLAATFIELKFFQREKSTIKLQIHQVQVRWRVKKGFFFFLYSEYSTEQGISSLQRPGWEKKALLFWNHCKGNFLFCFQFIIYLTFTQEKEINNSAYCYALFFIYMHCIMKNAGLPLLLTWVTMNYLCFVSERCQEGFSTIVSEAQAWTFPAKNKRTFITFSFTFDVWLKYCF